MESFAFRGQLDGLAAKEIGVKDLLRRMGAERQEKTKDEDTKDEDTDFLRRFELTWTL